MTAVFGEGEIEMHVQSVELGFNGWKELLGAFITGVWVIQKQVWAYGCHADDRAIQEHIR